MENKRTLSVLFVILSIATFVISLIMNFSEFQYGGSATIKSVIVTFLYITVWIFVLVIGIIARNRGAVKYCLVFWIITFIAAIAAVYGNMATITVSVVEWIGHLILPLMLLFLGQWYGLRFFIWGNITRFIIIAVISLAMLAIAFMWLKHNKST